MQVRLPSTPTALPCGTGKLTKWDAVDIGPKRDIVGAMEMAIRRQGMKFITTYHRHWLYSWYTTWDTTTDASNVGA